MPSTSINRPTTAIHQPDELQDFMQTTDEVTVELGEEIRMVKGQCQNMLKASTASTQSVVALTEAVQLFDTRVTGNTDALAETNRNLEALSEKVDTEKDVQDNHGEQLKAEVARNKTFIMEKVGEVRQRVEDQAAQLDKTTATVKANQGKANALRGEMDTAQKEIKEGHKLQITNLRTCTQNEAMVGKILKVQSEQRKFVDGVKAEHDSFVNIAKSDIKAVQRSVTACKMETSEAIDELKVDTDANGEGLTKLSKKMELRMAATEIQAARIAEDHVHPLLARADLLEKDVKHLTTMADASKENHQNAANEMKRLGRETADSFATSSRAREDLGMALSSTQKNLKHLQQDQDRTEKAHGEQIQHLQGEIKILVLKESSEGVEEGLRQFALKAAEQCTEFMQNAREQNRGFSPQLQTRMATYAQQVGRLIAVNCDIESLKQTLQSGNSPDNIVLDSQRDIYRREIMDKFVHTDVLMRVKEMCVRPDKFEVKSREVYIKKLALLLELSVSSQMMITTTPASSAFGRKSLGPSCAACDRPLDGTQSFSESLASPLSASRSHASLFSGDGMTDDYDFRVGKRCGGTPDGYVGGGARPMFSGAPMTAQKGTIHSSKFDFGAMATGGDAHQDPGQRPENAFVYRGGFRMAKPGQSNAVVHMMSQSNGIVGASKRATASSSNQRNFQSSSPVPHEDGSPPPVQSAKRFQRPGTAPAKSAHGLPQLAVID